MFEKFTERAQKVVMYAQEEAIELRHGYIGTEHILLGILEENGLSKNLLNKKNVTLEIVKELILQYEGQGDFGIDQNQIPLTPRTKRILDLSLVEARNLNQNYVTPEHILLAITRESDGVAYTILTNIGVNMDSLRQELLSSFSNQGNGKTTKKLKKLEV